MGKSVEVELADSLPSFQCVQRLSNTAGNWRHIRGRVKSSRLLASLFGHSLTGLIDEFGVGLNDLRQLVAAVSCVVEPFLRRMAQYATGATVNPAEIHSATNAPSL